MYNVASVLFHDEQVTYFDDGHKAHVSVADALGDKRVVLIKNHGAIVASQSMEHATIEAVVLEEAARYHLECEAAGGTEIARRRGASRARRCTRSTSCRTCGRRTTSGCASPTPTCSPGSTELADGRRVGVRPAARSRGGVDPMSAPASVPVGVQLYSLREEAAADFPAVLERLGAKGFVGRRVRGLLRPTRRATSRRALDESGLAGRERARRAGRGGRVRGRARRARRGRMRHGRDPGAFEPGFGDLDKVKRHRRPRQRRRRDRSRPRHHPRVPQPLLGARAARRRPARAPALLRAPRARRLRRGRHLLGAGRRLGSGRDRDRARRARAGCCT